MSTYLSTTPCPKEKREKKKGYTFGLTFAFFAFFFGSMIFPSSVFAFTFFDNSSGINPTVVAVSSSISENFVVSSTTTLPFASDTLWNFVTDPSLSTGSDYEFSINGCASTSYSLTAGGHASGEQVYTTTYGGGGSVSPLDYSVVGGVFGYPCTFYPNTTYTVSFNPHGSSFYTQVDSLGFPLFVVTSSSSPFIFNTLTQFLELAPHSNQTISTSSVFVGTAFDLSPVDSANSSLVLTGTFSNNLAQYCLNPADSALSIFEQSYAQFTSSSSVDCSMATQTQYQTQTFTVPASDLYNGYNNFATSTSFGVGQWTETWTLSQPTFLGAFGLYFPISVGQTTLLSTTTQFVVGTTSSYDDVVNADNASALLIHNQTANYIASTTASTTACNPFSSNIATAFISTNFNLLSCITLLVLPSDWSVLQASISSVGADVLTSWPVGYVGDVLVILSTTTQSTLPSLNVTLPSVLGFGTPSLSLPIAHQLDFVLNATTSIYNTSQSSSTETLYQFTSVYWDDLVYLLTILYIVGRIVGTHLIPDFDTEGTDSAIGLYGDIANEQDRADRVNQSLYIRRKIIKRRKF
ncbi:MAG TPA: hypothetical protein VMR41_06330 [Patescibacteria group bacterium]|nr:hypothetical protein [Patescibacteria group bacterium]